ncbi:hypothetical protein [Paraconexibacter algicola]|uniref:Calcium-binding protein n=1 Tax=Paraconexibacter algicola TaxID=2133960 RepID=A0A2T4UFR9_9ACTN|nr:hypothetical protein [Paraconexibacter algicola]PTL56629.1 hypothetical protein C7Y72_16920 [Paraconexibacter algicola]
MPVPLTALTPMLSWVITWVCGSVLRSTGSPTSNVVVVFGVGCATDVSATKKQQNVPCPGWASVRSTTNRIGAGLGPLRTVIFCTVPVAGTVPPPVFAQVQSGCPDATSAWLPAVSTISGRASQPNVPLAGLASDEPATCWAAAGDAAERAAQAARTRTVARMRGSLRASRCRSQCPHAPQPRASSGVGWEMPRSRRPVLAALVLLGALAGLAAPSAQARVLVVADGGRSAVLTDVTTNRVLVRVPVGGVARASAVSPDGTTGYASADDAVAGIDLQTRRLTRRVAVRGVVVALAVSPDGGRLYAVRRGGVDVIDTATFTLVRSIAIPRSSPGPAALSPDGQKLVTVTGARQIGIVNVVEGRFARRLKLAGATGVAFGPTGSIARVLTAGPRGARLLPLDVSRGRLGRPARLKAGVGGGVAVTRDGRRAIVGAAKGRRATAIVDLASGRTIARVAAGAGPGYPATSPDSLRFYVADRGAGTVSVFSTSSLRRLTAQRLARTARPVGVAVQPGIATTYGTEGPDTLSGTRLADRLFGLGGDDTLNGGRGNDQVFAGAGNDVAIGGPSNDVLQGEDGDDRLSGQAGDDTLVGGPGQDAGFGGTGNDQLDGGPDNDYLDGGDGDDTILGGEGDDKIVEAGFGNDRLLDGGPGNDYVDGGRGTDKVVGGDGNDQLFAGPGSETVDGGVGDDLVDGGTGNDLLLGRDGNDVLQGDAGRDRLLGAAGSDELDGGSGDDDLSGGDGDDQIVAGPGQDRVSGGRGADLIRVADGDADTVDCGSGRDTVYVESDAPDRDTLRSCEVVVPVAPEPANDAPPAATVVRGTAGDDTLNGTPGPDTMLGADGFDRLFGLEGDDYVDGENGNDELHGGPGDDRMHGRNDDDVIFGEDGDDYITGDRGADAIDGGPGNDSIFGNLDPDTIQGGDGDDRINVVGGALDVVACGPGTDTVFADADDTVATDCEVVRR